MYSANYSKSKQLVPRQRQKSQLTPIKSKVIERKRVTTEPWLNSPHKGDLRDFFKLAREQKLSLQNQLEQEYVQLMKQKHGEGWTLDSHKSLSTTSSKTKTAKIQKIEEQEITDCTSYASTLKDFNMGTMKLDSDLYLELEEPIKNVVLDPSKTIKELPKPTIVIEEVSKSAKLTKKPALPALPDIKEKEKVVVQKPLAPIQKPLLKVIETAIPIPIVEKKPQTFLDKLLHKQAPNTTTTAKITVAVPVLPPIEAKESKEAKMIIYKSYADKQMIKVNTNPQCPKCDRHFALERLEYHASVCKGKVQPRKPFDMKKKRQIPLKKM